MVSAGFLRTMLMDFVFSPSLMLGVSVFIICSY